MWAQGGPGVGPGWARGGLSGWVFRGHMGGLLRGFWGREVRFRPQNWPPRPLMASKLQFLIFCVVFWVFFYKDLRKMILCTNKSCRYDLKLQPQLPNGLRYQPQWRPEAVQKSSQKVARIGYIGVSICSHEDNLTVFFEKLVTSSSKTESVERWT